MNAENLAEHWVVLTRLRFTCVQQNGFFNLLPRASFFIDVNETLVILQKLQQHLPIVIHEFWVPELKEQRASPGILPVNKATNSVAFHEEIRGMEIPMPNGGTSKLLISREEIRYDIQELFVKRNVSTGRILSFRCNEYIFRGVWNSKAFDPRNLPISYRCQITLWAFP